MTAISAKKPSILTSRQPRISKAWWIGVIRKMRLPWVALKYVRWMTTVIASQM